MGGPPTSSTTRTRLLLLLLVLLAACALWTWLRGAGQAVVPGPSPFTNRLTLPLHRVEVPLHDPIEYDGMTREQWYAHRRAQVALQPQLADPGYEPSAPPFGRIEDGLPWWGLHGEFCVGSGDRSHEGLSEESRFLSNPYLLVGLMEGRTWEPIAEGCFPVWPRPTELWIGATGSEVVYDLARFAAEKDQLGMRPTKYLRLIGINAADWGYNRVEVLQHQGIAPTSELLSDGAVALRTYIHRGPSCGQATGCNNGSPREPGLWFELEESPARLELRLLARQSDALPDLHFTVLMR